MAKRKKFNLEDEIMILATRMERQNQKIDEFKDYMKRKFREILKELRKGK